MKFESKKIIIITLVYFWNIMVNIVIPFTYLMLVI